jgi:hypothetical protein
MPEWSWPTDPARDTSSNPHIRRIILQTYDLFDQLLSNSDSTTRLSQVAAESHIRAEMVRDGFKLLNLPNWKRAYYAVLCLLRIVVNEISNKHDRAWIHLNPNQDEYLISIRDDLLAHFKSQFGYDIEFPYNFNTESLPNFANDDVAQASHLTMLLLVYRLLQVVSKKDITGVMDLVVTDNDIGCLCAICMPIQWANQRASSIQLGAEA